MKEINKIINTVFKALGLALGVALFVCNAFSILTFDLAMLLVSMAIICISFSMLSK